MNVDTFRAAVVARIRKGSAAHPGTCTTAALVGKTFQKRFSASDVALEAELTKMVKEGLIVCTSGMWWNR
jgi:hypothetical protein